MLNRLPLIPTLVVLAAVALMVRLGFWQIDRMHEKDALLERYRAASAMSAEVSFPVGGSADSALFRRATLECRTPVALPIEGAGQAGNRFIVRCENGALLQLGTALDPATKPIWQGGIVTGIVSTAPDHRSWVQSMGDKQPAEPMLIADPPLAGLQANARPDPNDIPNNHWSYAIQWFLFALTALVIYGLALRGRIGGK
ncbi:MAG: SURF1 family cytochrome oxidase biogenesis protein [Novosphingobium sp.]